MAFAEIDGGKLFYEATGEGPPVLLVPGLGATHLSFAGVAPRLAERRRVIAVDLRGVGRSDPSARGYSMEAWADDLAGLLEQVGGGPAHVVGSSLGGCVALALADRHPALVRSLVLAATFSEIDRILELNYRVRMALVQANGMSQLFADYAIAVLFGRSFFETEAGRARAAMAGNLLRQNDADTYVEHLQALLRFGRCEPDQAGEAPFTERLPSILQPALVMCGEEDVLTVPKFSHVLAERLPNATLSILPKCGHANFGEQPEQSARLIVDFLDRLAA